MKRQIGLAILMTTTLIAIVQTSSAQTNSNATGDSRIQASLEELGFKYEIDKEGDFKVVIRTQDGRTQLVWIISKTQRYGKLEIREIVSPAYLSNEPLSLEVANQLLEDNTLTKLGAWQIFKQDKGHLAMFVAKIPADSDANNLGDSLEIVARSADAMENKLTGKDKF